jgi:hypothetical protein
MKALMMKIAARKIGDFVSGDGSMWSRNAEIGRDNSRSNVVAYERIANKKVQTKGSVSKAGRMRPVDKSRLNLDDLYSSAKNKALKSEASSYDQKSPDGSAKNVQRLKLWKKKISGVEGAADRLKAHGRIIADRESNDKLDWITRDMRRHEGKSNTEREKHERSRSNTEASDAGKKPKGKGLSTGAKVGIGVGLVGAAYGAKKLNDHIKAKKAKRNSESENSESRG